ncbi:MAG: threonylcarbamoyl-AMP synthase [Bacteroidia bacterium]|nr:threonylcarbamoyl-AMP synthase [Bacteroidia bacterium]
MATIGTDIAKAARLLTQGECVAMPTETVYGLAANAFNEQACLSIFKIKNRPSFDPLIVHCCSINQIEQCVTHLPKKALLLFEKFSPGPLTIVLNKKDIIPDIATAGLSTVGIRIPAHPIALELLKQLSFPLAAPSANPFGYISPTTAQHVNDQLGTKINYILNGGTCSIGIESTIVGFENERPVIYRLGGLSVDVIENFLGHQIEIKVNQSSNPKSPGQIKSHYAPLKPLVLKTTPEIEKELLLNKTNTLFICFTKKFLKDNLSNVWSLSDNESLDEAATNLFAKLRLADESNYTEIIVEKVPSNGLGLAINDRLSRASYKM